MKKPTPVAFPVVSNIHGSSSSALSYCLRTKHRCLGASREHLLLDDLYFDLFHWEKNLAKNCDKMVKFYLFKTAIVRFKLLMWTPRLCCSFARSNPSLVHRTFFQFFSSLQTMLTVETLNLSGGEVEKRVSIFRVSHQLMSAHSSRTKCTIKVLPRHNSSNMVVKAQSSTAILSKYSTQSAYIFRVNISSYSRMGNNLIQVNSSCPLIFQISLCGQTKLGIRVHRPIHSWTR